MICLTDKSIIMPSRLKLLEKELYETMFKPRKRHRIWGRAVLYRFSENWYKTEDDIVGTIGTIHTTEHYHGFIQTDHLLRLNGNITIFVLRPYEQQIMGDPTIYFLFEKAKYDKIIRKNRTYEDYLTNEPKLIEAVKLEEV